MLRSNIESDLVQLQRLLDELLKNSTPETVATMRQTYIGFLARANKEWLHAALSEKNYLFANHKDASSYQTHLTNTILFLTNLVALIDPDGAWWPIVNSSEVDAGFSLQVRLMTGLIVKLLTELHQQLISQVTHLDLLSESDVQKLCNIHLIMQRVTNPRFPGDEYNQKLTSLVSEQKQKSIQKENAGGSDQNSGQDKIERVNQHTELQAHEEIKLISRKTDTILACLEANRDAIRREAEAFVNRLNRGEEITAKTVWTGKLEPNAIYLYYINMLAFMRHDIQKNDFKHATALIAAMELQLQQTTSFDESFLTAITIFSPGKPLLQEYCWALCAAIADKGETFTRRMGNLINCARQEFQCKSVEHFAPLAELLANMTNILECDQVLSKQIVEQVKRFLEVTDADLSDFPLNVISLFDLRKLFFVAIDSIFKTLFKQLRASGELHNKSVEIQALLQLVSALDGFMQMPELQPLVEQLHTHYYIAITCFYRRFNIAVYHTQLDFDGCHQAIQTFFQELPIKLSLFDELTLRFSILEFFHKDIVVVKNAAIQVVKTVALTEQLATIKQSIALIKNIEDKKTLEIKTHRFSSLIAYEYHQDYSAALADAQQALALLGSPENFTHVDDHEIFMQVAIGSLNTNVALVRHHLRSAEQLSREQLISNYDKLCEHISHHWFFSVDAKEFSQRMKRYAHSPHYITIIDNLISLCLDSLVLINLYTHHFPGASDYIALPTFKLYATHMKDFARILHAFVLDEGRYGKLLPHDCYSKLARVHIWVQLLCAPQSLALPAVTELQTFFTDYLMKNKSNVAKHKRKPHSLTYFYADLRQQMMLVAENPYLANHRHLSQVKKAIPLIQTAVIKSLAQCPASLKKVSLPVYHTESYQPLRDYYAFVSWVTYLRSVFITNESGAFLKGYNQFTQSVDTKPVPSIQVLPSHFFTLLQPSVVRRYLLIKSYADMLTNDEHTAVATLMRLKCMLSERYGFTELAEFYGLEQVPVFADELAMIDRLITLIHLAQTVNTNLGLDLHLESIKVFNGQAATGGLWQQLPPLPESTVISAGLTARDLLPFISHLVTLYLQTCEHVIANKGKKMVIDKEQLDATYRYLLPYLSSQDAEHFKKVLTRILAISKHQKAIIDKAVLIEQLNGADARSHLSESDEEPEESASNPAPQNGTGINGIPSGETARLNGHKPTLFVPMPTGGASASQQANGHADDELEGFTTVGAKPPTPKLPVDPHPRLSNRHGSHFHSKVKGKNAAKQPRELHMNGDSVKPANSHQASSVPSQNRNGKALNIRVRRALTEQLPSGQRVSNLAEAIYAATGKRPSYAAITRASTTNLSFTETIAQFKQQVTDEQSLVNTYHTFKTHLNSLSALVTAYVREIACHDEAMVLHMRVVEMLGYSVVIDFVNSSYILQHINHVHLPLDQPLVLRSDDVVPPPERTSVTALSLLLESPEYAPSSSAQIYTLLPKFKQIELQLIEQYRQFTSELTHKNALLEIYIAALASIHTNDQHYRIQYNTVERKSYLVATRELQLESGPSARTPTP
jgi:hypothetical protein